MWINTTTRGEFVLHADIRYELWKSNAVAPGVLTDDYLASVGYAVLTPVQAAYDPITQYLAPRPGTLVNGVWEKHFEVLELDPAIVANNYYELSSASPKAAAILQAAGLYDFARIKAAFILQVKSEAGALTQRVLAGLESEYELAEKEATAYKAAGYPAIPIPGSVQSEVNSKAANGETITAAVACDTILTAATGWRKAQAALRNNRLTTTSAAGVAVDGATLDTLRTQWRGFMHNLYGKLEIQQTSFQQPDGIISVTIV